MFEHLDDPNPPHPGRQHRDAVQKRTSHLRRRRRFIQAGSVAVVAAAILAFAVLPKANNTKTEVRTAAPVTDTSIPALEPLPTTPTSITTAPPTTTTPTTSSSPGTREWSASPTSGPPGVEIAVMGSGCVEPGDYVQLLLGSEDRTSYRAYEGFFIDAASDGSWRGTVKVPLNAQPGAYVFSAACIVSAEPHFAYPNKRFVIEPLISP